MESDHSKTCTGCGLVKPLDQFHKYSRNKTDGRQPKCKKCQSTYHGRPDQRARRSAAYHKDGKGKEQANARRRADPERARAIRRDWQFNLKPGQYDQMLADQDGRCALCKGLPNGQWATLAIDHDHQCCPGSRSCGKCVRQLLCSSCNTAIGLLSDNPLLLRLAAEYIEAHGVRIKYET